MHDRSTDAPLDQAVFWNEEGGRRWVENIDHIEKMIESFTDVLLERAAPAAGERVLDVGCGGGVTSAAFAGAVAPRGRVVGVDLSRVILEIARERYANVPNLQFESGDATDMPLDAGAFDLIMSRFGVMFFHDPFTAFKSLRHALDSDGRLVFMCWRAMSENPWMALPAAAAFEILPAPEPPDPDAPGPFSLADPDRTTDILESSGFQDVRFDPLDRELNLGPVSGAVEFLSKMGPAASALGDASDAERAAVTAAMERTMQASETADGVRMASATWVVQATAG